MTPILPRVLIIDDLFGREVVGTGNRERASLCAKFLLQEESIEGQIIETPFEIPNPVARVVFTRGQIPASSTIGDTVENDLDGSIELVRRGWTHVQGLPQVATGLQWSLLLVDLCFCTGRVTEVSDRATCGMPVGRPGDDDPGSYFGLTLLDAIHREFPELPIFVLSSKPRDDVSLELSRRGALGFIDRSDENAPEQLAAALWHHGLVADRNGEVIGNSLPMLLALREARRAAGHFENVLIRGERGTGKERLARYLHASALAGAERRAFVTVNSAIFTPNLFSSELFGIEPRTATGVDGKIGLIESATGGDLFFDEIADMPPEVQAAVLRVLQERQVTRVGGRTVQPVDVRFLSATNAELEETGRGFRLDLLDRLRLGGTIWLPPLRERPTDIPLLAMAFVREVESARRGARKRQLTHEALELLEVHSWPGNVRELRMVIFDVVSRYPDVDYIVPGHLRFPSSMSRHTGLTRITAAASSTPKETLEVPSVPANSFTELLRHLNAFSLRTDAVDDWAGRLNELQEAQSRVLATLVLAAVEATKRRTTDNLTGQIQIHPAFKLLTGNKSLTASKAADLAKRILAPLAHELNGELAEVYRIALRLRPRTVREGKKT